LKGLLDIFTRKSNEEIILSDLMMLAQAGDEVKKDLEDQDEKLENLYKQISYEIKNFKNLRLLRLLRNRFRNRTIYFLNMSTKIQYVGTVQNIMKNYQISY
jgi:hypothetical protein